MKKFTAIILVFCMLAATLVTGLSVFAAQDADTGSETQKIESVNKPTAFVQFKENGNSYDTRVVVAAPEATIDGYSSASIVVSFVTAEGKTVSSGPRPVTGIYLSVNAGDDTYTAADGNVLFGVVVTNVPYGTKSVSATLTATTGEESTTVDIGFSDKLPADKVYTVSELYEVDEIKALTPPDNNKSTSKKYTAKGEVKEIKETITNKQGVTYYSQVTITDGNKDFLIWTLNMANGVSGIEIGDVITVNGYIKNHPSSGLEFASNGSEYVQCIEKEVLDKPKAPTHGLFKKVTAQAQITEGTYLFVYQVKSTGDFFVFNSAVAYESNAVEITSLVCEEGIYAEDAGQYFVQLEECPDGGFAIRLPSGAYLHGNDGSNIIDTTSKDPVSHTFTYQTKDGAGAVQILDNNEPEHGYLRCYASNPKFAYYTGTSTVPNFTLYKLDTDAVYTTHTVTFMSGAAIYARQTVVDGQTATEPATNPTKAGFEFKDWCTDDGTFEKPFDFETPIQSDVTVYAHFVEPTKPTVKQYEKVTDESKLTNGGSYLIVYEDNSTAHVYEGWHSSSDVNCFTTTTDGSVIAYSEDLHLYEVKIEPYNGGYSIQITSGTNINKYLNRSSDSNGSDFKLDRSKVTITIDKDGVATIKSSGGAFLLGFKEKTGIRINFFQSTKTSGKLSISLYKLVDPSAN